MWFIFWTRSEAKAKAEEGYFNCPQCRFRTRCARYQMQNQAYLYGVIPLGGGEFHGQESYQCLVCGREWGADTTYGFDFGLHAETQAWRCFKCNKEVPYESFECPHCNYRLDVG